MKQTILTLLEDIEKKHQIKILYACEAGSRAYNVATPVSDYDIRFIYVSPLPKYLSLRPNEETITVQMDSWDIQGWDLKKALTLALKSNPSLFEWMFSPIHYRKDVAFWEEMREIATNHFSRRTLVAHYVRMSKKNLFAYQERKKISYLYHAIRAVLMMETLMRGDVVSLDIPSLGKGSTVISQTELRALLEAKSARLDEAIWNKELFTTVLGYLEKIEKDMAQLPHGTVDIHQLQKIFNQQLGLKG